VSVEETQKAAERPPTGAAPAGDGDEEGHGFRLDSKTIVPALGILALIIVPVLVWAATSGGSGDKLRIDQGVSVFGGPEIVVNVPKKLNLASETGGATSVKLICEDGRGNAVLSTNQPWPFINEVGYPYPHIHQSVTPKQLQAIATCHLVGTKTKLSGNLRRT